MTSPENKRVEFSVKKNKVQPWEGAPQSTYAKIILGLLGGPWRRLDGPSGHYVGPHGCSSTRIVTK